MKTACLKILLILLAFELLILIGCSTIRVQSLSDDTADLAQYKRFAVSEPESFPPNADPRVNEITMRKINRVIEEQMIVKGFQKTGKEDADFLVASYANIQGKIDAHSYGYTYGYYGRYGGWGLNDVVLREYDQGTLVIDFVAAANNSLIWRGWATAPVSNDADLTRMQEAVAKILAQYPPL